MPQMMQKARLVMVMINRTSYQLSCELRKLTTHCCLRLDMRHYSFIALALFAALFIAGPATSQPTAVTTGGASHRDRVGPIVVLSDKVAVTTYHYDNLRTGWNPNETMLTSANFPRTFGILASITLDDQVDAQPLIVPNQTMFDGTKHDVVFVATASNTVYAIDASTGAILYSTNLGPPVPTPL